MWTVPVSPGGGVEARRGRLPCRPAKPRSTAAATERFSIAGNSGTGTLLVSMLTWSKPRRRAGGRRRRRKNPLVPSTSSRTRAVTSIGAARKPRRPPTLAPAASSFSTTTSSWQDGRASNSTTGAQPPPPPPPAPTVSRPLMQIDYPANGSTIRFRLRHCGLGPGSRLDLRHRRLARTRRGVPDQRSHADLHRAGAVNQQRPDVGNHVGNAQFAASGFGMSAFLPPGEDPHPGLDGQDSRRGIQSRARDARPRHCARGQTQDVRRHAASTSKVGQTFWISGGQWTWPPRMAQA